MIYWYPDLAEQVLKGLHTRIRPSLSKFLEGAGYLPDWDVILMQTAYCIEPIRLTPALLIERVPYTRPDSFLERLRAAARRGWLHEEDGKFNLTKSGYEVVEGVYELGDRLYAKIEALTDPEMAQLRSLSDCVIGKIKELPEPPKKLAFELSLNFDRGVKTPLIVRIRQQIFILLAFRDDAHIAAWRPYEADGHLWETFTLIWRKQAGSASDLVEMLPHRNYTQNDYATALDVLRNRGWISDRGDIFAVKDQAARMRQEVEEVTDRTFATAFSGLSLAEKCKFQALMRELAKAVTLQEGCAS
jgi:hypothetical protein